MGPGTDIRYLDERPRGVDDLYTSLATLYLILWPLLLFPSPSPTSARILGGMAELNWWNSGPERISKG